MPCKTNPNKLSCSLVLACLLLLTAACSKGAQDQIVINVPANFSGQIRIEMGVSNAPALQRNGRNYEITVPPDGKFVTSTILVGVQSKISNVDGGHVWGYSPSVSKTGDGLPVGGTIEFFVGTKEQYESAEAKKHRSNVYPDVGREVPHRS
jgi:hypothetical protein